MADSRTSVGRQLQDVAAEAARLQTKLVRDYVATMGAVGRGRLTPRDYIESVRSEGGRYLGQLVRLNIDYAREVQRLVTTSSSRLTGVVQAESEPVETKTTTTKTTKTTKKTAARKSATKKATAARKPTKKAAAKRPARARRTPRQPA